MQQDTKVVYSRTNPFQAKVLKNRNLNKEGSSKETRHLELSLAGSGLSYNPGDALGVYPTNDPELVSAIIEEMKWNPAELVPVGNEGETLTLTEALTSRYEITALSKKILSGASAFTPSQRLGDLLKSESAAELREYTNGRDLLDMLRDFTPWNLPAQTFVGLLRKLTPRLYSISSAISMHSNEVHLTIGAVRYHAHDRLRKGVCSVGVAERLHEGDTLPVFIQPNKHFHLPDPSKNIIMVGPGTGIAPFRSFIEERATSKASGKPTGRAWLFFGDQHAATDFLYEDELTNYLDEGVLTKLTTAFSRDSDEKVYVQTRMQENSEELFIELVGGAYFYVCGDKQRMAKDVHETLISIFEKEGGLSRELAEAYLAVMQDEGRYQRDVY